MRQSRRIYLLLIVPAFLAASCAGSEEGSDEPDQTVIEETGEAAEAAAKETAEIADEAEDAIDDERTVEIASQAGSAVSGNADFRASGESTRIEVELTGLETGASYTASLREGTCGAEGLEVVLLGSIGGQGDATPDVTTTVPAGTIETGQQYHVAVLDATGTLVACGEMTG